MTKALKRLASCLFAALLLASGPWISAQAKTKTLAGWLEGFDSGEGWFGQGYAYDITDTAACWELLQRPITVLDVGEREVVYPLTEPGGKKVNNDPYGGFIAGTTAAVHVLGKDEGGWTLIEGLDCYDRLIQGYVKTKLLKTVTPHPTYGIIVDKLTQRMYVFKDGQLFSDCGVSTGLPNDDEPFNETASGEYLISSWVGDFDNEGLVCAKALRFNNGDLFHEVPYTLLGDGTKRYSKFEALLGQKASHGCIRVARLPNAQGLCQSWLWDNLKKYTKVVIWDDDGRAYPYPDPNTQLFYNTKGGQYYHAVEDCSGVRKSYLPLTGFLYSQMGEKPFSKLEPCPYCVPVRPRSWIDQFNKARGFEPDPWTVDAFAQEDGPKEDAGGAVEHPVEIVIIPAS
ncbi:MAG: L,D-transpeptidase [Clostridiales bacterium]|nr:L,D-transpeptidase [Clostridiales bacterium]